MIKNLMVAVALLATIVVLLVVMPAKQPKPKACCLAMTAQCLACMANMSVDKYCAQNTDTPGCAPRACCKAMTAQCLACSENTSVDDYCSKNPKTIGCVKEDFALDDEPVWSYWENRRGKSTPAIVKRCHQNWKEKGKVQNIIFLNPDNLNEYIPDSEIARINRGSAGNLAVKSDFIGLFLLHKYGGTVLDGTVYMNSPLSSWLSRAKGDSDFFCFTAERYAGGKICPETYFMSAKKGSIVAKEWYERLYGVGEKNKDAFFAQVQAESPELTRNFVDNYLWVYLVGVKMLTENPSLSSIMSTKKSENGPLQAISQNKWSTNETCNALKRPQSTDITKLDNGLWGACDASIVPVI